MALEILLLLRWRLQAPHDSQRSNFSFLISFSVPKCTVPLGCCEHRALNERKRKNVYLSRSKKQGGRDVFCPKSEANCIDLVAKIWTFMCLLRAQASLHIIIFAPRARRVLS